MPAQIVPVIMCGGAGTRLWPVSRESRPKQFVSLVGQGSTFQQVLARISDPDLFARPIVITHSDFRFVVAEQLRECGAEAERITGDRAKYPMSEQNLHEVSQLLLAWSEGDKAALDRLVPLVYAELRRLAKSYMRRERAGQTMQTTALIHEAYLRLIDADHVRLENRAHFFAAAARVMRQVLVDLARERGSRKRGGDARLVPLDEAMAVGKQHDEGLLALDEALGALAQIDPRKSRVVELRFFGGLSVEETAEALGVSAETVHRDWRLAKSWLLRRLRGGKSDV